MNYEEIDLKWQNMLAGIKAQVPFVASGPGAIFEQIRSRLGAIPVPEKVYLVGCGDSWYCGMATRCAFEEWAGIPAEPLQALEFSRYLVNYAPKNSLVVAVSNSGRVSRTIECVQQARKRGLMTVGLTSNLKEGLSQAADVAIDLAYSERRFGPGTSSYMASMIVQYCLAIYLGVLKGRLTEQAAGQKLAEISALAEPMERTISESAPILEQLAGRTRLGDPIVFIGGGPNYGTAFFSMAKVIEASRVAAVGQELEEWAHEQFFCANSHSLVFVLAPPGASLDRAREQTTAIRAMGATCVVVCDSLDRETAALGDVVIPVCGQFSEILSPILYCIPAELFAFHYAVGNQLTMLGFDDERLKAVNWQQIFGSKMLD